MERKYNIADLSEYLSEAEEFQTFTYYENDLDRSNSYTGYDDLSISSIKDEHIYAVIHDGNIAQIENGEPLNISYFFDQATYDKFVDPSTGEFDKDEYQVLLVADKYQTGFDQKKLCAMYILKKLHGISTVQTLSRLNRICPPYDKKTFILDFANDYDAVVKDFSKYYTTTLLSNSVTPTAVYDIEAKLDGYYVIDPFDVEKFNNILYKKMK